MFTPNLQFSNRSAPLAEGLANTEIWHKGPIKCFAISGFKVCTGQNNVRTWYLPTGENTRTVPMGELKIACMQFPPCRYIEDEGQVLWVSVERGDIFAIDVDSGEILERSRAHSSTVCFMLRSLTGIWNVDENGAVMVWSDYEDAASKVVSLHSRPKFLRTTVKPQCCHIVGDEYWAGYGKLIEVYSLAGGILKKLDVKSFAGNTTCLASTRSTKTLYSGHEDGKIVVWDADTKTKRFVVHAAVYRITCMIGVGDNQLWAGYSTGKIYVYDVTLEPWLVCKDWEAHKGNTITDLIVDNRSILVGNRLQVASLGDSGIIRVWDGLLTKDWVEHELKRREEQYCTYRNCRVFIGSWNIDAHKPQDLDEGSLEDVRFLPLWLATLSKPEIISIGFQEIVDLESKKVTAKSIFKSVKSSKQQQQDPNTRAGLWKDRLIRAIRDVNLDVSYEMIECQNMVGLFSIVFIRTDEMSNLRDVAVQMIKTGLGGYHGNKVCLLLILLFSSGLTSTCL